MNLLLDTHVLLWSLEDPDRLKGQHRSAIEDPQNSVWASSISVWELVVKASVGKLKIPVNLFEGIRDQNFKLLPFTQVHAFEVSELPLLHRDPFDRALIAQARYEKFHLVTNDRGIAPYADFVKCLEP